jgi:dimethyladenosine transferase 1
MVGETTLNSGDKLHLVGNLPFEIAGQLLMNWNTDSLLKANLFSLFSNVQMTLIFPKEMGSRLLPSFSKRNRFSTITQTAFDVSLGHTLPKTAFTPRPSTDCIVLKFDNRKERLFQSALELEQFLTLLKKIYVLPNKQLGKVCKQVMNNSDELLAQVGLDHTERIFAVSIAKLIELSKMYHESQSL